MYTRCSIGGKGVPNTLVLHLQKRVTAIFTAVTGPYWVFGEEIELFWIAPDYSIPQLFTFLESAMLVVSNDYLMN